MGRVITDLDKINYEKLHRVVAEIYIDAFDPEIEELVGYLSKSNSVEFTSLPGFKGIEGLSSDRIRVYALARWESLRSMVDEGLIDEAEELDEDEC